MFIRRIVILSLLVFAFSDTALSQRKTFFSKSELGVMFGGSYYVGDLNPVHHFRDSKIALGLIYRYNINQRIALRVNAFSGEILGDDNQSEIAYNKNRNLSFQSRIFELGVGMEINMFKFRTNDFRHPITPYFTYSLALFYHNPKANYNGNIIELREIGTEGQGTYLSDKKPYSKVQFAIPLGVGLKFLIAKRVIFSVEYGFRLTFTDYLDDVSGHYVDKDLLAALNGPIAAEMSDKTIVSVGVNGNNTGTLRGKSETKDFYGIFSAMLSIQLGKDNNCPFNVKARF